MRVPEQQTEAEPGKSESEIIFCAFLATFHQMSLKEQKIDTMVFMVSINCT